MTTVSNTSGAGSSALASTGLSGSTDKNISQTQDRFLNVLVAQMKSQDPLNPMDNAQVTSQIAQISTVQGIEKLNTSIQDLNTKISANQLSQSAAMLGKSAMVAGNTFSADGIHASSFSVEMASAADSMTVSLLDSSGNTVQSLKKTNVAAGLSNYGVDAGSLPAGNYTIKVDATLAGKAVSANPYTQATITGLLPNASGMQFGLSDGRMVSSTDIKQVL